MNATMSGCLSHQPVSAWSTPVLAQLVRLVAALDRAAIDDARWDRRELARGHGDHRLVRPDALVRPAQNDQEVAHRLPGDRHQLRVAKALTDLGGLPRSLDGASRSPAASFRIATGSNR